MKEISIEADQVKRSTISDLRSAAQNDGIFGDEENTTPEEKSENDISFSALQKKYICLIKDKIVTVMLAQ